MYRAENIAAITAALKGAELVLGRLDNKPIGIKESFRDVVTQADIEAERLISLILNSSFQHEIIGEEASGSIIKVAFRENHKPFWAVDPIDGTANYVNGLPGYATSIGLIQGHNFIVGAVCSPQSAQLYCTLGDFSVLNGRIIKYKFSEFSTSLIGVSFSGASPDLNDRESEYQMFGVINDMSTGCLRTGSAALNICLAASGSIQCAYGLNAAIWDIAGGVAIALKAGCIVSLMQMMPNSNSFAYIVGSEHHTNLIKDQMSKFGFLDDKSILITLGKYNG